MYMHIDIYYIPLPLCIHITPIIHICVYMCIYIYTHMHTCLNLMRSLSPLPSEWHYLSRATFRIRPHVLYARFVASRTIMCC